MKLKISWWITFFGLCLFVSKSHSQSFPGTWGTEKKTYIDIDTAHNDFLEEGSGRHPDKVDTTTDDEDLFDGEGSGDDTLDSVSSGSGDKEDEKSTAKPPTTKKMTACEQLRLSTKDFSSDFYIPECEPNGEYKRRQCEGKQGSRKCWCVDHEGREIPGTQKIEPMTPDCKTGTNLKPCVFELLKNSRGLLGAFSPRCTLKGDYENIQCHVRQCWCVDKNGIEKIGSRKSMTSGLSVLNCTEPEKTTVKEIENERTLPPAIIDLTPFPLDWETTKKPHQNQHIKHINNKHHKDRKKPHNKHRFDHSDEDNSDENTYEVDNTPKPVDVSIEGGKFTPEEDNNENDKTVNTPNKPEAQSTFLQMIESPGILAAVIGGSVVGLLCAILLVMFIVYRMRKKDEGSYPLEEQKYTNISYMKAPDKEFYA